MKRTPMKRESAKTRKRRVTFAPERTDFQKWRATQHHCYTCGWKLGTRWPHSGWLPRLEANHIFGHAKRERTRYAVWAIVMLCQFCHQEVWTRTRDRQRVVFGAVLKLRHDAKNFDLEAMNAMHGGEPVTLEELEIALDALGLQ